MAPRLAWARRASAARLPRRLHRCRASPDGPRSARGLLHDDLSEARPMSDLAGIENPFRVTVVPDPWQPNVGDVAEIHERPFHACVEALEAVRREGQTRSVLLFGEPGSGKTHLLRRLRAHWIGEPPHEVDPIRPAAVFVAAKLQTSPQHL